MPGIHVCSNYEDNWERNGTGIIVPGSYWLCHKRNIYKFIFKLSRAARNKQFEGEFVYGKDLLRIIRKVLKSKPDMGQQFSSKHLLVTFSQTSWTRQDKMFALLKFQEKDALPYAYAFILTIKILPKPEKNTESCELAITPEMSEKFNTKNVGDIVEDASDMNSPCHTENQNNCDEGSSDALDLPYQYLIEKDIKKANIKDQDQEIIKSKNITKNEVPISSDINKSTKDEKIKGKNKESGSKSSHKSASRSANITNQVMEGLMFTIREDKNAVCVTEQKTKLEIDEVLENSEKSETKKGEKCLVNSSLLRLENLVTKIDGVKSAVKEINLQNGNSCYSNTIFPENPIFSNENENEISKKEDIICVWEKSKKNIEDNETDYIDEDIFPEFYNSLFAPSTDEAKGEVVQPKIDDTIVNIDSEHDTKNEIDLIKSKNDNEIKNLGTESNLNEYNVNCVSLKSNKILPKVVSNEIISIEQIPLPLQKALQARHQGEVDYSNENKISNIANGIHDLISESSSTSISESSYFTSYSNISSENLIKDKEKASTSLKNTPMVIIPPEFCNVDQLVETDYFLTEQKDSMKGDSVKETSLRRKRKSKYHHTRASKRSRHNSNTSNTRCLNQLQDITKEFYRELFNQQKKEHKNSPRCLRQRISATPRRQKNCEIRIEMLKFVQDMQNGAKVVIQRLSPKYIAKILGKT